MEIIKHIDPVTATAEHLTATIKNHLNDGEHVLWLLSGGSGIKVVLETARMLVGTDMTKLSVTLSDERYGDINHLDENWKQLLDGGFILPGAAVYRPLTGEDRSTTAAKFGTWLMQRVASADYTIGLFGIGSDGHAAGIKPHSSAVTAATWTDSYTGDDFERITMTPFAISQIDEVVVQASGADKLPTLRRLLGETVSVADQPAQILKTVPKCTLYTNITEL